MRNSTHSPSLIATLSLGLAAGLAAITSVDAYDDEERRYRGNERLGKVEFPVACKPKAQVEFNRGMALFHSFLFKPANQSFTDVLSHDPGCAMAYWGMAFMSLGNPFAWPAHPKAVESGAAALAEAERIGAKTARDTNRYQTIAAAARAAREAGDAKAAGVYYADLVRLGDKAQVRRPELVEAREFLRR